MIYYAPERCDGLGFLVEEVFKETRATYRSRVGIPLSVIPEFGNPIEWLSWVNQRKQTWRIQEGAAGIVQDSEFIGFNANHNIRLPER